MSISRKNIPYILFGGVLVSLFVLIYLFVNIQQDKYNYFLYLYGDSVKPGSTALVKVISRDGEIVPNPGLEINGKKVKTQLIKLTPNIKEIRANVGKFETIFPFKFSDLDGTVPQSQTIQLSNKDIEHSPKPATDGKHTIYLLPEFFRFVPEMTTKINLFCVENATALPCSESEIIVNGNPVEMNKGYAVFETVFRTENKVQIAFSSGDLIEAKVPYKGKMFDLKAVDGKIKAYSLVEISNVHIDCFSKQKWVGTDILRLNAYGVELPKHYKNCHRIQLSFNSNSPGTTFVTYTESPELIEKVTDPYYVELAPSIDKFSRVARYNFFKSYNSSFFTTVPLLFSGTTLENQFLEDKNSKLDTIWWIILVVALFGLGLFIFTAFSNIKEVEGIDGELISHSKRRQYTMLVSVAAIYIVFISMLLYLFKNLA
jgi:hypothetical protein